MLGNGSFLNSPWNTQVATCDQPRQFYTASWLFFRLVAEEQLRSLAERKRIVVPMEVVILFVVADGKMFHRRPLCMCYTHCTFVMCNPKHYCTQLLWVIPRAAPPTVAEAKPVRWSLPLVALLLAFARQQRVFRKHQAGRRHVGERVIFEFTLEHSADDMRPPVSRQRRYCFTWNNYPLDAEEQLRSLAERKRIVVPREAVYVVVVRRRRRYVTDGVDTPYYSIFES